MKSKTPKHRAYMLRTCASDMSAYGGFIWPKEGIVVCPDWDPSPECGHGLHGLLWGEGDSDLLDWSNGSQWLVVGIEKWVEIGGKIKTPCGDVVYCGDMQGAAALLVSLGADPAKCVGGTSTSGYRGTSTSGYRGTSTSGDGGTSTSGFRGTSTSGDGGTSTSGDWGTSTSGNRGTSTSGDRGTSTSGDGGTSTSGDGGTIVIQYYDAAANRYRLKVGYIGEDGLKANTAYRLEGDKFVEAKK